tara:strand:- start:15348 stop:16397 length:1050 start_codon:yes stop_codon:yes gene_type:complete
MGTTLTGTKVKDTYKSLVKLTDNAEASATGKQLSDGNGNDLGVFVDTDGVVGIGAAAAVSLDVSSKTDAIRLPNGTTAQRVTGTAGQIRYNTTTNQIEGYVAGSTNAFVDLGQTATSGDITAVTAGDGLTGGGSSGDVTLAVGVDDSTIEINSDALRLKDAGTTLAKIQNVTANSLLIRNANSSGVLSELALATTQIMIGDGTGMVAAALSGDVTMDNAGAVTIANDAVEHAMLENRYTAKATSTGTGSQNLDASAATSFLLTGNVATATLTIQNMKLGQVIDIQMTGTLSSAAITLATDFSSTTINKVGSTDFDTSEKNVIQVVCVDDTDAAAIINYSVAKLTVDTTP